MTLRPLPRQVRRVLLLCVDTLRCDRLRLSGYPVDCCPTLNRMAATGIACTNVFAHANRTQFSYPTVMTSTLPLDCGGYDHGIVGRPLAIAEVFRQQGFRTAAFSSSPWQCRMTGYARGFDEYCQLDYPHRFWLSLARPYVSYCGELLRKGAISRGQYEELVPPVLERGFAELTRFCDTAEWIAGDAPSRGRHPRFRRLLRSVRRRLDAEMSALRSDPRAYLRTHEPALAMNNLYALLDVTTPGDRSPFMSWAVNAVNRMNPYKAISLPLRIIGRHLLPSVVSDENVIANVVARLGRQPSEKLFIWVHLSDVHDRVFLAPDMLWALSPPVFPRVRQLHPSSFVANLGYDMSLRHSDRALGGLVSFLERASMLDDTLLVVFGDHGGDIGGPFNDTGNAYDRDLWVPLLFWAPGMTPLNVRTFGGLIDLAPSLCDLMGFPAQDGFRGRSLFGSGHAEADHLILENLGGGPCDIPRRPARIAVRTARFKYIAREAAPPTLPPRLEREEFYDLKEDPAEKTNLAARPGQEPALRRLREIAAARIRAIREQLSPPPLSR